MINTEGPTWGPIKFFKKKPDIWNVLEFIKDEKWVQTHCLYPNILSLVCVLAPEYVGLGGALESKGMVGCMSGTLNAGQNAKQGGGTHA